MILVYVVFHKSLVDIQHIDLIGYLTEKEIEQATIIPKGGITRFGTLSQVDNRETWLKDYHPFEEY